MVLEILVGNHACNPHLGRSFLQNKYLTNPMVTPEDRVTKAAGALARALDNQMPLHMRKPTIQALSDL